MSAFSTVNYASLFCFPVSHCLMSYHFRNQTTYVRFVREKFRQEAQSVESQVCGPRRFVNQFPRNIIVTLPFCPLRRIIRMHEHYPVDYLWELCLLLLVQTSSLMLLGSVQVPSDHEKSLKLHVSFFCLK